jgi:hypothetical protein
MPLRRPRCPLIVDAFHWPPRGEGMRSALSSAAILRGDFPLEEGAEPSLVAFALTSVAADMALQITGDPLKVFPVLLTAIAHQASRRSEEERPPGATVH